jgi:PelA/Pel-15E family pectate lyase
MKKLTPVWLALWVVLVGGSLRAAEPLATEVRATMEKATAFMRSIATEGGYLWRYSPDLKERAGESIATPTQIWVQPPGTPSMGMAFLRAYEVTGDGRYLDAAKAAADALAVGQLESGGWDYVVDFDPKLSAGWYRRTDAGKISVDDAAKRKNTTTFDDDNTQSALRLLLAVADVSKGASEPRDMRIRTALEYALTKLLAAQRPNGGWPQRWTGTPVDPREYPVQAARFPQDYPREYSKHNYNGYYTLNDNTQRDCVQTLLEAAKALGRADLRAAALRGGDFLVQAQLPEPQPAWAQQYNARMEPAWARAFEPPCVCTSESAGAMRLLVDLYLESGDAKYLEPLPRAIAWFRRSEIAPGIWARMYELGTNTPVYGDRDGKIKYRVEDLSPERQTGYSWKGAYGVAGAIAAYEGVKAAGRDATLARQKAAAEKARTPEAHAERVRQLEPQVKRIVGELDATGRWISNYRGTPAISTETFIFNTRLLADYLEAVK